jgi:hypothetical protein
MADLTRFITYYIQLTDPNLVKQYQAQFPYGYQFAPYNPLDASTHLPGGAAVAFQAPWNGSTPVPAGANGTWSPDAGNYDTTVATFTRKSGGFWGMGGTTVRYYWLGQFRASDPPTPTIGGVVPPAPVNLAKRIWIEGWEFGNNDGTGVIGGSGMTISRGAARHVGGLGLALRGPSNGSYSISRNVFGAAANTRTYERLYVRLRTADPTNTIGFWQCNGSVSGSSGARLAFTPDNRIAFLILDNTGAETLIGTTTLQITPWDGRSALDGFHKLDIFLRFNPNDIPNAITSGRLSVYLDGVLVLNFTTIATTGLGQAQNHASSSIGTTRVIANTMECDIDDWVGMEWPGVAESAGGPGLNGRDFLSGSKIVAARPKAFGANHSVNWIGAFQQIMALPLSTAGNDNPLTSTTASAISEADLDVDLVAGKDEGSLGVTAFTVHALLFSASNGQLGYRLNAGANVDTVLAEINARTGFSQLKAIADGTIATTPAFTSLTIRRIKAADAVLSSTCYLGAQVEMIGTWGTGEDYRATESGGVAPVFPRFVDQHNAPYPRSMFGKGLQAPPPDSPVIFVSGTYVGNGLGLDLTFRAPVCAFFARIAAGADGGGYRFISGSTGPHVAMNEGVHSTLARADQDTTFVAGLPVDTQQERYRVRLGGSNSTFNQLGTTYQYFAIIDPGARFFLSGTIDHKAAQPTTINALIDAAFTPEAMFFQAESLSNSTTDGAYFKGVGVTTDNVLRGTTSAQLAAAITLGAGVFTTQPAFHALANHMAYLAMRRHDGNNDPGEPGVLALVNWTGDGTASRTVSIAPTTGKRPIYAIIFASDAGGSYFRDVAHTTTNSERANTGANSATAITGGAVDALSVGVTLNANGVIYSGIVFLGDATAGNGGFGVNNEYIPVEAAPPADGPFPTPTIDQVTPPVVVVPIVGEPDLDAITVLSDAGTNIGGLVGGQKCEYYTRHVVNMALSRIGVSKRIVDLANDLTEEAVLARSHVLEDVNQVLRDFDWPFATRYATLVLVAGTSTVPVNQDWQYSYRLPTACMKARRLVNQTLVGRDYDRNPPKFRIGGDDTGTLLLYTNEATSTASPLVLEYTVRSICPSLYGDALFRDALAWKFAFSLAPPLSKDSKKQDYCRAMYERAIALAKVPAAQEQQQAKPGQADWINDRDYGGTSGRDDPWNR